MQTGVVEPFQQTVWAYYRQHGRHDLPWRQPNADGVYEPYRILVSEVMLQQTQVPRVLPKFIAFTARFPSFATLAAAPLADVLKAWSGLGYNRRAKFLWQAARMVTTMYGGTLPDTHAALVSLPGIGVNTAGAIMAYAFGKPVVFIETNIRTVYIHHFFPNAEGAVHDRDIADIVAATVPDNSREWYWALMDYGTYIKQTVGNVSRSSVHYSRQSVFAGSRRQLRGRVLRALHDGSRTADELQQLLADDRLGRVLADLTAEALVVQKDNHYRLPGA